MGKMNVYIAILLAALCTFGLRGLPFLLLRGGRKMPAKLQYLGGILPVTIMAVLVVYCLKDVADGITGIGGKELIGAAVVAASYKWKHNTLLSIVAGTAVYMMLVAL